ncbi:MAG TPA: glycosyltransferase family 4 protein [Mycobacteriales bacterium]|jgi:glycosyltransferase involved in cell wall biosynthesis|nr:glycosyltransferase family 4 protein [Mycobacteriales bacterium]
MRIAHVTDCYLPRRGGIELQVQGLAKRQQAAGHDVTIVTSVAAPPGYDEGGELPVERPAAIGHDEAIRYGFAWRGRTAVLAGDYDVVHVHASTFSPLAFFTAQATARAGVPTAMTIHSLWRRYTPLYAAAERLTAWGDWPVAFSAVSQAAADPLRRILRGRAEVTVLPNGVDPARWRLRPVSRTADEVRVVAVMRLAPRKRPRQLLEILRDVRRRVPARVRLYAEVIGEGPERRVLERAMRRHGMTDWVALPGWRSAEEIGDSFARADVFIAPATLESFGIAALEARAAGLPVVARRDTGIADFVRHRRDGLLGGSDRELADAVVELAVDRVLRERIAQHNRTVMPPVTWRDALLGASALYQQAAALVGTQLQHPTLRAADAASGP